ncbi:hypothetical protein DFH06DRAFT_1257392 [Mycena polygramma]|nr:hypothetical protein DFH06DRAFT_1257392 [Mycena polygramma]
MQRWIVSIRYYFFFFFFLAAGRGSLQAVQHLTVQPREGVPLCRMSGSAITALPHEWQCYYRSPNLSGGATTA